jgi:hypothetical protein
VKFLSGWISLSSLSQSNILFRCDVKKLKVNGKDQGQKFPFTIRGIQALVVRSTGMAAVICVATVSRGDPICLWS